MKILIAIDENKGIESRLSEHFGHCSYFAIYETTLNEFTTIKNEIDHSNKDLNPVEQILNLGVDEIFSLGMGQRAISLFNEKNIKVRSGKYLLLKEVIENIKNLEELNSSCSH